MEIARGTFSKLDDERRLAFGWASVVSEDGEALVDKQDDVVDMASLEDAVYGYVLDSRAAGEMHERTGVGRLVESVVMTAEKLDAMGIQSSRTGRWIGFRVESDEVWKRVKSGEYS